MRYDDARSAIDAAVVGVFAFVDTAGRPVACAITPYLDRDTVAVSSTLAFTAKARAVALDGRAAVLAGGLSVSGPATVAIDLSSATFDAALRAQELRKFPPSRQLLAVPGHRRLLWWYVGRATVRVPLDGAAARPGDDAVTVTTLRDGALDIRPVIAADLSGDHIAVDGIDDGPACLLAHVEGAGMADLRQLALHGRVVDGVLHVERRTGSLEPAGGGALAQLRQMRAMRRAARRSRPRLERWAANGRP